MFITEVVRGNETRAQKCDEVKKKETLGVIETGTFENSQNETLERILI